MVKIYFSQPVKIMVLNYHLNQLWLKLTTLITTRPGLSWFCLTVPGRESNPDSDQAGGLRLRLVPWAWLTEDPGLVLFWIGSRH